MYEMAEKTWEVIKVRHSTQPKRLDWRLRWYIRLNGCPTNPPAWWRIVARMPLPAAWILDRLACGLAITRRTIHSKKIDITRLPG
jgi:hypothetical protein